MSRKSFSSSRNAIPAQAPTKGAAREREAENDEQSRHHQRRPDAIAREQNSRGGGARDEHQHARVGHVVAERALRPAAEIVELQHAELEDADSALIAPTVMITCTTNGAFAPRANS